MRSSQVCPRPNSRPLGFILLAEHRNVVAGCIGLRPIDRDIGEIKRLYVVQAHRGHGIGRRMIEATITESKKIGYAGYPSSHENGAAPV